MKFLGQVCIYCSWTALLLAQAVSTSQIRGTIQDSSGAAVAGAQIKATQTDTGVARSATSGADGGYVLPELPIGPYRVEVVKDGFSKYLQTGIVLQVASNPTIDVEMKIGAVTEQVQVQANAAMVETQTGAVGQVVDSQRVTNLPLIGRNVTDLVALSGGATNGSDSNSNTTRNYPTASFSVAGGLASGAAFVLDGAVHNDMYNGLNLPLPFPDALQEFKIETSALPAQYGMHAAAAINAVTKSGTNDFHGDAFEFVRNYLFNARNFFSVQRDSLKRNQFGGTIGGPVRKNKLFFFAGFQDTINRQNAVPGNTVIPTAAMLGGDFTAFASASCNNGTPLALKAPFVNNKLPNPAAQLNPAAVAIAKQLPATADPCGKIVFGTPSSSDDRQAVGKVDYQMSEKHSLFARYVGVNYVAPIPYDLSGKNLLTTAGTGQDTLIQSVAVGDTYLVTPNAVNSFRATFNRSSVFRSTASFFSGQDEGINMFGYTKTLGVAVTGGFSLSGTGPGSFATTTYQLGDDLGIVRGNHQMAFGASLSRWVFSLNANVLSAGNYTFSSAVTGAPLGDFLTGNVTTLTQSPPNTLFMHEWYVGFYGQDTWRITPRFTVNYGARWEPFFPQQINDGHVFHFDRTLFAQNYHTSQFVNAPVGLQYPGDAGFPGKAGWNTDWKQLAPRVSLAWDPRGNGRMSIRAAFGMFYDTLPAFLQNSVPIAAPWVPRASASGVNLTNPWSAQPGGNPFPLPPFTPAATYTPFGSFSTFNYTTRPDYVSSWNVTIQRQIAADWLISASYLGNEMTHLLTDLEGNPAVIVPSTFPLGTCPAGVTAGCNSTTNTNQRRLLSVLNPAQGRFFGSVALADSTGTGSYHGLLVSAQRRLSRGITASANYTLSHCISDNVTATSTSFTGNAILDPNNRRFDRGNCNTSGTDRRHLFNLTLIAQTPKFTDRWMQVVAGGWRVSGIVTAQTGSFLNITTGGVDRALDGITNQRVNLVAPNAVFTVPSGCSPAPCVPYLNSSAFAQPALGTNGNLGAASVAGPGFWTLNAGLSRTFRVLGERSFEIRAEASNLLNHFNPGNPVVTFGTNNFGQILATAGGGAGTGFVSPGDPRILQFGFKYLF